MRPMILTFVILSPLIAFCQNDTQILSVSVHSHAAHALVVQASVKLAEAVNTVRMLLA